MMTPSNRFEDLEGYPFSTNYKTVGEGIQMHYVDEGPKKAKETLLLMHGEPSWSYLYRKMIPVFVKAGYRCIAPDLIGFGKSSKPRETANYSYALHIKWVTSLLHQLDLQNVTFFGQDWGGLIGLRVLTAEPNRFKRIVVANTGMPTGDHKPSEAFSKWQAFSQTVKVFPFEKIMQNSTTTKLSRKVLSAYSAPFPHNNYMAGARIFPALVPTAPDNVESENNRMAWKVLMTWEKPLLTLFSDNDPITKGGERPFQKLVPGAKDQPHQIIEGGGHFLQEDKGKEIAAIMVDWIRKTTIAPKVSEELK
ncbi:MAG: haloalkane dehalogenase [Chitinophagales bacterium]